MTSTHPPRRDDRSTADPFKQQWDKYSSDHRRHRAATLPRDPRAYPPHDARYNDPRLSSRTHRHDQHHSSSHSYPHQASAQPQPTSRTYQHATRPPAQHTSSAYPQQSSSHQTAYPLATSSRRQHTDVPDLRTARRPPPPSYQPPHDHVSSGEEMARTARHPRVVPSSTQPPPSAPSNQAFWNPPREISSRRHKDPHRDREAEQERDRDRDKERERAKEREREKEKEKERDRDRDRPTADPENRCKDRSRTDRLRERERERATEVRYQEPSKTRHHDRRKDSDTDGVLYSDQKNASRTSLHGREGHPSIRESSSGHRRHRTEDGMASTQGRRHHSENTQNPITTMPSHSISVPQPEVQQTGEPPPAPRVMPVYPPPKAKVQRSHREARPPATQGAQSWSDTERVTSKHRMERTPSGPAVQRNDGHASSSTKDRSNHDVMTATRDDMKRVEVKYGHQDLRQPLGPINVDIPLVTPGFNASSLPTEPKISTVPQIVSIHAGQGPSDPHDAHFKSAILHSDAPQDTAIHPHPTSASIIKPSNYARSQSFETRVHSDRPVVSEYPRVEPHGDDLPPGERVSIHEPSRAVPTQISKSRSYARGNTETGVEHPSYPHSRPPSRSAHRTSANNVVPPAVVGPRPLRSTSQGPQANEPPTRPPSIAQYTPTPVLNQHSVPPSPAHPTQSSPSRVGHTHVTPSSAQPSPKNAQLHGVSLSHSTSAQQAPSASSSIHPTLASIPQTLATSSRPPTRDKPTTDIPHSIQQSADRRSTDDRAGAQQTPNSTTVKASWVVQTPTTAKRTKISREEKYLRDHHLSSDTPRAQLRQVLQDDDSFPHVSSLMMKASQATTPSATSQRNSPGSRARDPSVGTPRGTLSSNSPMSAAVREPPTPEHVPRQNSSLFHAGPPHIAVVGATPDSIVRDLPHHGVDHALLAPPFPPPTLVSRTISNSHDPRARPLQPVVRDTSLSSYHPQPTPAVHPPSLFQPYRPPSLSFSEELGQSSPPPLPIPPPRSPEDSPPPPIETRTSEIFSARSQTDGGPKSLVHSIPVVQSEMFHVPTQPLTPPQASSATPPRTPQTPQAGKPDKNAVLTPTVTTAHADERSLERTSTRLDDAQVAYQDIVGPVPVLPSQSSGSSTKPRPKVTIEDIAEDLLLPSKTIPASGPPSVPPSRLQPSYHTVVHANAPPKVVVGDQAGNKSSPPLKGKDPLLHRSADPGPMPAPPPMPLPTLAAAPVSTRMPSSTPTQPTSVTSAQAPAQRATSHAASSRTHQRATEMLQASKLLSTGANPGVSGSANRPAAAPVQLTHDFTANPTNQHQPLNGVGTQSFSTSRLANGSVTPLHPAASGAASTTKVAAHLMSASGTPTGALGLHITAPSTSINTQSPSAPDPPRQQSSRSGTLSIPTLDTTSTSVIPTTAVKNVHQEAVADSTRTRDAIPPATHHPAHLPHVYPSARPGTSSATSQQTHVVPSQPLGHHRVVSLPITSSSSAPQRPLSPRKYSQPIPSTTVSTQPFPSRPSILEPQPARAPAAGHVATPAPVRSTRLQPPDRTHDSDILKTPSSIAPSPMLNPDTPNALPQPSPIRARQPSTDSKDDKKKPSGLFGLFRTRTLSSKAVDPPIVSAVTRASVDQGRTTVDSPIVTSTTGPVSRGVTSTSAAKDRNPSTQPAATLGPEPKLKNRVLKPVAIHPPSHPGREQKDATQHILNPFKILSMHSKRNRTVSAASLDVCDGNTATNTVVGSPDHSAISQAPPLPHFMPPDVRDPFVATSEWRDREETERRERRTHRPGVTFDVEEGPPSPAPGTATRRKRLVRRPSGRAPTPGPPRG